MAMSYSSNFNLAQLRQTLFLKQQMVDTAVHAATRAAAEMIEKEAKANAPVDTHHLEDAIHTVERETRRGNIGLDIEVSGAGSRGRDIADYAWEAHERITPAYDADLGLGPLSQAKQDADPEHTVGGLYMERAVNTMKKPAINLIKTAVKEAVI